MVTNALAIYLHIIIKYDDERAGRMKMYTKEKKLKL